MSTVRAIGLLVATMTTVAECVKTRPHNTRHVQCLDNYM